jgi:hypothetical protein
MTGFFIVPLGTPSNLFSKLPKRPANDVVCAKFLRGKPDLLSIVYPFAFLKPHYSLRKRNPASTAANLCNLVFTGMIFWQKLMHCQTGTYSSQYLFKKNYGK